MIETKLQEIETEHEELCMGVMDAIPECGGNEDIEELVGHLLKALLHARRLAIMTGSTPALCISETVEAGFIFAEGER